MISWNFEKHFRLRLPVIKRYNVSLSSCQISSSLANGKGRGRGSESLTSEEPNISVKLARNLNCTSPLDLYLSQRALSARGQPIDHKSRSHQPYWLITVLPGYLCSEVPKLAHFGNWSPLFLYKRFVGSSKKRKVNTKSEECKYSSLLWRESKKCCLYFPATNWWIQVTLCCSFH